MANKILMPASGQTAAESRIVRWNVEEGEKVNRGDVLFEIETDKAVMGVESYAKGTVLKIVYGEGDDVEAGKVVAYIGEPGEKLESETSSSQAAGGDDDEYQPIMKKAAAAGPPVPAEKDVDIVLMASPKARKIAKETGADLKGLYAAQSRAVKAADVAAVQVAVSQPEEESLIPLSAMRKVIARRMLESVHEAPQYTVSIKADMTAFIALRRQINEVMSGEGIKVSINDILVRCVVAAAAKVPYINAVFTDEGIRTLKQMHVGIAVAVAEGLVVPVLRNANTLPLRDIARTSQQLINAAKEGRLRPEQMQGGTITISNLGMYGIDRFTAIINRPESAILAVGAVVDTPVGVSGSIVLRPIMDITATFDHRIIDGAVGAQFMAELKKNIEQPLAAVL